MEDSYRLVERQADEAVFLTPRGVISARQLSGAAQRLVGQLGTAKFVVNGCRDRALFAVGFLAAVLAGRTSLLIGDRSPASLEALAASYGDLVLLGDDEEGANRAALRVEWEDGDESIAFDPPSVNSRQLAALVFTSGSTGRPVAHEKMWGALVERSIAADAVFGFSKEGAATLVGTVPPEHMYGFETTVLQPLHTRCVSWSGSSFFPDDIRQALAAASPSRFLVSTPLHLRALLRTDVEMPEVRTVISATAPLERSLAEAAEQRWKTDVLEIFGATEVGSIASRRTTQTADWKLYPEVQMRDDDDGGVVVEAPFARAHPLNDVVEMVEGGFRLVGRQADMVKVAGRRASLGGLNQILMEIPGVRDGAFLAPAELGDDPSPRLVAFVVAPTLSAAEILAALRERMEAIFLPRRIEFLEELPRNALGKLSREAQLALLAARHESEAQFSIARDHPSLPGHFPGHPIVPGVLLLAEALATMGEARVEALPVVKFSAPVRPEEIVTVRTVRLGSHEISFRCAVEGRLVLEGRARLAGIA